METTTVGRTLVTAKIENLEDALGAHAGKIPADQIRSVTIPDALADTGAQLLGLPRRYIQQLGLRHVDTKQARTSAGLADCKIYAAVWLTVEGQRCTVDVAEVDDESPILVGYVPLELMNYAVDPVHHKLILDPHSGGQNVLDML